MALDTPKLLLTLRRFSSGDLGNLSDEVHHDTSSGAHCTSPRSGLALLSTTDRGWLSPNDIARRASKSPRILKEITRGQATAMVRSHHDQAPEGDRLMVVLRNVEVAEFTASCDRTIALQVDRRRPLLGRLSLRCS